jgi:hypothetical protein
MIATYVVGAAGCAVGLGTVNADTPSLTWAALLAVFGAGFLSFVRHSIFFRSDAARMGWELGEPGKAPRNNFQIEVGLANLAWAVLALLAVVLGWGLVAQAAAFLTFGFYLLAVAVMLVTTPGTERTRPWSQILGMGTFAVLLTVIGFLGMAAA